MSLARSGSANFVERQARKSYTPRAVKFERKLAADRKKDLLETGTPIRSLKINLNKIHRLDDDGILQYSSEKVFFVEYQIDLTNDTEVATTLPLLGKVFKCFFFTFLDCYF